MLNIREIDHLVLRVRDMAAMRRFYCDALGCVVEREVASIGLVQLRAGRSLIDLMPGNPGRDDAARNLDHFCVRLDPFDVDEIRRELRRFGIECPDPIERYGAEGNGPSIYVLDPEGNQVELKGPPFAASSAPARNPA